MSKHKHEPEKGGKKKKGRYLASFQSEWSQDPQFETWLRPVTGEPSKAFCGICRSDFSIGYSGVWDVRQHANGVNHKKRVAEIGSTKSIQSHFSGKETLKVSSQYMNIVNLNEIRMYYRQQKCRCSIRTINIIFIPVTG